MQQLWGGGQDLTWAEHLKYTWYVSLPPLSLLYWSQAAGTARDHFLHVLVTDRRVIRHPQPGSPVGHVLGVQQ